MKQIKKALCILLSLFLLTACGDSTEELKENGSEMSATEQSTESIEPSAEVVEQEEKAVAIEVDFTNGQPTGFECANGWCNGSVFNVTWRKSNVTFKDGKMQLVIEQDATPANNVTYSGGEFRSRDFYGYGRYEVSMKAIQNDGVVSSFFTYTGPSDNNPWDEIDVEILGKDTTKVQFNYYTNGKGEHEYMHELGFDAAEDFHTYAFEWYEDKILWFVDGVEVHRATENIPVTKGKIMMNAWCGIGVDEWLAPFDDSRLPLTAEYQWLKYTPFE